MPPATKHMDANETIFFEREHETVLRTEYNREYQPLEAMNILPMNSEAGEADDTVRWFAFDAAGFAKFVSEGGADDVPMVDVYGEEHTANIRTLGVGFNITMQEIRRSMKAGRGLDQRKATTAREAMEQKKNQVGFYGDASRGILGLFTAPNTQDITASTPAAGSSADLSWSADSSKTPAEIVEDFLNLVESIPNATKGTHRATHVVLPANSLAYIKLTELSAGSGITIYKWILENYPGITIESSYEFQAVTSGFLPSGASGSDSVGMAYEKRPENLAFMIAMAYLQHAAQQRNLNFVTICEERVGGVIIWRPLTVAFMEGI